MANPEELYIPRNPQNIPYRPISKGMILNLPSNQLPQGALLLAENYIVGEQGPIRRPSFNQYAGGSAVLFPPLRFLTMLTKSDGSQVLLAGDTKAVYEVGDTSLTAKHWDFDTGTAKIDSGSRSAVGSGTYWDSDAAIQAGDVFSIGSDRIVINSVEGNSLLTLEESATATQSLTDYDIWKSFIYSEPYFVDFTQLDNKVVFADSNRPLFSYDGSSFTEYDSALTWIPTCVTFFKDRLWCGRIQSGANDYRSRIIWSTISDHTSFDVTGRYVDLPYSNGYLHRLVPFGRNMLAFFTDAIYLGRPTNIAGDDLPLAFERINTGGIGLVGMYALCSHLDGVYFVGQDDIYFISSSGIVAIGTPVVKDTIDTCDNLWAVHATVDATRNRIIFGFPVSGEDMQKLWSYDYKAKAWSYDAISCTMVNGEMLPTSTLTWDNVSGALSTPTWDTGMSAFSSWDSIRKEGDRQLYIGKSGKVYQGSSSGTEDEDFGPISCTLETPDFDDGYPDRKKTNLRVSIKIDRTLSSDLTFSVYYSNDRGTNYTSAGNLTIPAGDDENFISFLSTGSTFRMKLVSTSKVGRYRIMEIVRRVRPRGIEIHLGSTD